MKFLYHPDKKNISLPGVLYALGDPVRLEIVRRLATEGEQCCGDFDFAIAKSTMSNHFKILREAGVILTRKEGTQHINILRREDLEFLFPELLDVVLRSIKNRGLGIRDWGVESRGAEEQGCRGAEVRTKI